MEFQQPEQHSNLFGLRLNDNLKTSLRNAATTARILAIFYIVTGCMAIVSFVVQQARGTLVPDEAREMQGLATGVSLFSAIFSLGINILFFYFLNRFAQRTRQGIDGNTPEVVTDGISGLSSYFIMLGIFSILAILGVLMIIFGAAAGRVGAAAIIL